MKQLLIISTLLIVCLFSACSSNDAPEPEYTGPWEVQYMEEFYMMHTNDPAFATWFNNHTENFLAGNLVRHDGRQEIFDALAPNETYDTFKEVYKYERGQFVWYEVIPHATETEMNKIKADFENFSVENRPNRYSDIFTAYYRKYEEK